jgi:hypothetical protein
VLRGFEKIFISKPASGDIRLTYTTLLKSIMQEYPVKRGFSKNLSVTMVEQLKECFGVEPKNRDGHYQISYGALKVLDASLGAEGKSVIIRTESDLTVSDETILDTNRKFRKYLDAITGYSTKERVKKAKTVE